MPFFPDLSRYASNYGTDPAGMAELSIGWLRAARPFPTSKPSEKHLDLLWSFSKVYVSTTRGFELCFFCAAKSGPIYGHRGEYLMLGSAEIRLFHPDGIAFAAPNLLYHFVADHHYSPPEVFLDALETGPQPFSPEHFAALGTLGRDWKQIAPYDAVEANRRVTSFRQEVLSERGSQ